MTGYTPRYRIPYPTDGDPIYLGAKQMQAMAEKIDTLNYGGAAQTSATTPEPGTLVKRDTAGRSQVADPVDPKDIANKGWVEARGYQTAAQVEAAISAAGGGSGSGGDTPTYTGSVTAQPDSIMQRDSAGRSQVAAPALGADVANKDYVDRTVTSQGFITSASLTRYATTSYVDNKVSSIALPSDVVRTSSLDALKTELFGGPDRTIAPVAEIYVTNNINVPRSVDWVCDSSWSALVDTDGGFTRSGTPLQTRYTIPVAGRYQINYQLLHVADGARTGGAMKVLLNGSDVLQNSIASRTATPSLEGPTMSLSTDIKLNRGDTIRWGYWYAEGATIVPAGFGKARSKITIRYVGSR